MFFHNFKYALKSLFRNQTTLFWTLLFPIGLATFMNMAFGGLMEKDEMLSAIPVAVVNYDTDENGLMEILEILGEKGDDQLLSITKTTKKKADTLLKDKKVEGIIDVEAVSLIVNENGYDSMILQTVLEEYKQKENIIKDVLEKHPEQIQTVINVFSKENSYFVESTTTKADQNQYNSYFYAIFAMSALFASFVGIERISRIQANVSALGMRRCLSPNHKFLVVISEYFALLIVQFSIEVITLGYMKLIGIDFGNKYPAILLILLLGCSIGISIGIIIGSSVKLSEGNKQGIAVGISMLMSVMADLCIGGLKNMVEHTVPILNRINPAVLISNSFYALNVYEDYSKYFENIIILAVMSVGLLIVSACILRGNRYASV